MIHRIVRLVLFLALLTPLVVQAQVQPLPLAAPNYAAAMRPAFAGDVNRPDLPHYDLAISVNPQTLRLQGHMELQFRNMTGSPLRDVVLRLIPNFPADIFGDGGDGNGTITNAVVAGMAVTPRYEAGRSAVRLTLPQPAAAGADIVLGLDWSARIEPLRKTDDSLPLPSYYPQLAVWNGDWRMDVTRFPDRVYATSGLYRARITVPQGWSVASSGSVIDTVASGSTTTSAIVTGPIREFAFTIGKFATARSAHDGTAITVHYRTGSGLGSAAQRIADHAAASLAVYNDRYGPYPFRSLQFHLLNAKRGFDAGVEYPGLIFMLLNGSYTAQTRFVTAHEVAHQWFYGLVGDDIYREPWLDEAFAQYSPLLVEERYASPAAVDAVYQANVAKLARGARLPAGLALTQYASWSAYYASVYGKGAQFLYTLRNDIGDAAFFAGLQQYVRNNKYGIAHTDDVRIAFERSSGKDLRPMFRQWIGRE